MKNSHLDAYDRKILSCIQEDASIPITKIADMVNLSHNACWRRIKRLEDENIISRRVTLLNPDALGLDLTAFVSIRASEHSEEWFEQLKNAVKNTRLSP